MKKKLTIIRTHPVANERDAKEAAALSPTQHLANAHDLIILVYADELKKPFIKKIIFNGKIS